MANYPIQPTDNQMANQNRDWRYLFFLLAAHHPKSKLDHTIRVGFGQKTIYLCSRCTGVGLGMTAVFGAAVFGVGFAQVFYLPLIGILPLLAVADWFTQSARLRHSNTLLRLGSGFLLGIAEALAILLLLRGNFLSFLAAVGLTAAYAGTVYLVAAKTGCLKCYIQELNAPDAV